MKTAPLTPADLASSVIAVPPLARDANLVVAPEENGKIIRHLEAGGITTLLYGGNAVLYHVSIREYAALLEVLAAGAGADTLVIPSVGPAFGTMMDQAEILRRFEFPTAMVLPQREVTTSDGIASGIRRLAESLGRPVILYIKHDRYIDVVTVKQLMDEAILSAIKYAVVRDDPRQDDYLRELVAELGSQRIVSGIGEQPAIVHMRDFELISFTSGCVCIRPELSMQMLRAVQSNDFDQAETIREAFSVLEQLRNQIHPIRVLHEAVSLAGIADTGPIVPLLSELSVSEREQVRAAVKRLVSA